MKIPYIVIFNANGILERLHSASTVGKVKYAIRRNLRRMSDCMEDISSWLRSDSEDNGWDLGGALPSEDMGFRERFETFLRNETYEIEPYLIPERYTETFDGITGEEEKMILWLIDNDEADDID